MDVFTVRIDGTHLKRLSPPNNPGAHGIPDWSADNRIIFSEWNEKDNYVGPVIVNVDGSNYHRITKAVNCTHVRWIPQNPNAK
jgi:hypothetical protein